jgi:hypothetical protein
MTADNMPSQPEGPLSSLPAKVADMDRPQLIETLRSLHCDFCLDFTDDFLQSASMERLRHIVLAAALHTRNVPCRST